MMWREGILDAGANPATSTTNILVLGLERGKSATRQYIFDGGVLDSTG